MKNEAEVWLNRTANIENRHITQGKIDYQIINVSTVASTGIHINTRQPIIRKIMTYA